MTFEEATAIMATARRMDAGKPIANNTRLYRRGDDCYAIRLHETDIITLWADGRVTLDTGGWQTVTTKARINEYGPVRVWSDKGIWYCKHSPTYDGGDWTKGALPFFDGITFDADGECVNGPTEREWARYLDDRKAMDARIKSYVSAFIRTLKHDGMPMPSGGDCWGCAMFEPAGMGDADHLLQHLEEAYYVPSLAINAMRAKGYQDAGIYFMLGMDPDNGRMGGNRVEGTMVRRALLAYLRDRLIPLPPGPNTERRHLRSMA